MSLQREWQFKTKTGTVPVPVWIACSRTLLFTWTWQACLTRVLLSLPGRLYFAAVLAILQRCRSTSIMKPDGEQKKGRKIERKAEREKTKNSGSSWPSRQGHRSTSRSNLDRFSWGLLLFSGSTSSSSVDRFSWGLLLISGSTSSSSVDCFREDCFIFWVYVQFKCGLLPWRLLLFSGSTSSSSVDCFHEVVVFTRKGNKGLSDIPLNLLRWIIWLSTFLSQGVGWGYFIVNT